MSGSTGISKGQHFVRWYNPGTKRDVKIYRYLGFKLDSERMARKLLLAMQTDVERGTFYLEKYKQQGFSDTIPFIENWIESVRNYAKTEVKRKRELMMKNIVEIGKKRSGGR